MKIKRDWNKTDPFKTKFELYELVNNLFEIIDLSELDTVFIEKQIMKNSKGRYKKSIVREVLEELSVH